MQVNLAEFVKNSAEGEEAERILRSCVHCGFCTATCPTYRLLGNELDGPRGRIYLLKAFLEGEGATRRTQLHLDRCLTCRACETACPSGVQYGRLADIGRSLLEREVVRPPIQRLYRWLLRKIVPYPRRFAKLLKVGRTLRGVLPKALQRQIPQPVTERVWPANRHARRMLVLSGCAQHVLAPNINQAAAQVLDRVGISLITASAAGCCGAVSHHLAAADEARGQMRRNIDAWWPYLQDGVEAIVVSASGCGPVIKDYGYLLKDDVDYAEKAAVVASRSRDLVEALADVELGAFHLADDTERIAFHAPCSLQHALGLSGTVESLLSRCGFQLTRVTDSELCCGSAGSYSLLQPAIARQLLQHKIAALCGDQPSVIATANIGCLSYLQQLAPVPVVHWIELLAERIGGDA